MSRLTPPVSPANAVQRLRSIREAEAEGIEMTRCHQNRKTSNSPSSCRKTWKLTFEEAHGRESFLLN